MTVPDGQGTVNKTRTIQIRRQTDKIGISALLAVEIHGTSTKITVDSGAAVTILSTRLFNRISSKFRPPLNQCTNSRLQAADGKCMAVDGTAEFKLKIGKQTFSWEVYVAPIQDEGLLGFDFLHYYDCAFEARRGIRINGQWTKCEIQMGPPKATRVSLLERTLIPAVSECVVEGKADFEGFRTCLGVVEPSYSYSVNKIFDDDDDDLDISLIIGNSLIDTSRQDIGVPVRILNPTNEDIILPKGITLGYVAEVESIGNVIAAEEHCESRQDESEEIKVCNVHMKSRDKTEVNEVDKSKSFSMASYDVDTSAWCDDLQELYKRTCSDLDVEQQVNLARLLEKYTDCFSKSPTDLGRTSVIQHEIDTGDALPVKTAPRRPPMAFEGEEEKVIQQQLDAGVLKPSTSPWASALVYVRKKCGGVRACADYRRVNDLTKKCAYPLPKISECLDCLGDAKIFSTLDMQSGYWQIEVKESDRPKTAIVTRGGLYEYVTMPFGLCGAPATFTRCMEMIFQKLQWKTLLIYIDDLIIFSPSISSHLGHLEEVFCRIKEAGLKLKPSKCNLLKKEVAFLGHIVTQDGVKTDPAKVECIRNWPVPKNLTEVRSFLGLTSYYRRFIQGYAQIAHPLNRLLEAGHGFVWDEDCQTAFQKLKEALMSDQVMAYPNNHDIFVLDTDASNTAIGAALAQMQWNDKLQDKLERPIAYASKSLSKTQRRYCTTGNCSLLSSMYGISVTISWAKNFSYEQTTVLSDGSCHSRSLRIRWQGGLKFLLSSSSK